MVLDQPQGEECGNCYYCVSRMRDEITESHLFKPDKRELVERYWCKRYPEPERKEKYRWCGEWKERKDDQNGN